MTDPLVIEAVVTRRPSSSARRGTARWRRRIGAAARDERGFSLIELLVVATVGVVVLGVPLLLLVQVFADQNSAASRSAATNRVEIGVDQILRDMRQATAATISSASGTATAVLSVPVRTSGGGVAPASQTVTWACAPGGSCTRQVGAGSAAPVIDNVASASFAPTSKTGATTLPQTNPSYVSVTVSAVDTSEQGSRHLAIESAANPITFQDGVDLRNLS